LRGVVQQQLQTLMQGQIVWEGLLWPGQTARWTLRPDPDGSAAHAPQDAPVAWTTRLDLHLPHLGTVQAQLRLHGQRLDVLLRRDAAAQRLDAALPQLLAALQAAGLQPERVRTAPLAAAEDAA
jgi:hypothetical protein